MILFRVRGRVTEVMYQWYWTVYVKVLCVGNQNKSRLICDCFNLLAQCETHIKLHPPNYIPSNFFKLLSQSFPQKNIQEYCKKKSLVA